MVSMMTSYRDMETRPQYWRFAKSSLERANNSEFDFVVTLNKRTKFMLKIPT